MTKYQFEIPDEEWSRWKDTVPRSKNLDERIRELLAADAEGRVMEPAPDQEDGTNGDGPGGEFTLQSVDVPGQGEVADQRRLAVRTAYAHVLENERVPKEELVEIGAEIAGDTYADENSMWKNLLQPALSAIEDVESEGASGFWRVKKERGS